MTSSPPVFDTVPDCVAHATSTLDLMKDCLSYVGLAQAGWRGTLDSSLSTFSKISYHTKTLSLSKFLLRKAPLEVLRDMMLRQVANILVVGTSEDPVARAVALGWKNLPRPKRIIDSDESRWELRCPCCGKQKFKNVITKKSSRRMCNNGHAPSHYKVLRNPKFYANVVVMRGAKRPPKRYHDEDSDCSGEERSFFEEAMAMGREGAFDEVMKRMGEIAAAE